MYYSVSAFGKNTSAIGVATNKTLDSSSSDFKWIDHGRVLQSYPGNTNWNAIDPNLILDRKGNAFLVFGSFWDGIKMVRLTKDLLQPAESLSNIPTIASRKTSSSTDNPPSVDDNPKDAGGNAIEAPFIFKKDAYYYLFVSIDYCCKGEKSTYKVVFGRSKDVEDLILIRKEKSCGGGGGAMIVRGDKDWYGAGHNAAYTFDGKDYIIYHGYDASDKGRSKLIIKQMEWKGGWPYIRDIE